MKAIDWEIKGSPVDKDLWDTFLATAIVIRTGEYYLRKEEAAKRTLKGVDNETT